MVLIMPEIKSMSPVQKWTRITQRNVSAQISCLSFLSSAKTDKNKFTCTKRMEKLGEPTKTNKTVAMKKLCAH
jgi:hypothetical protein